ncbi:MAG TPA: hypothetical protein VMS01_04170 [Stellaceae bacterium]|nr:hypothetical protein [Stellaceae bacterium]
MRTGRHLVAAALIGSLISTATTPAAASYMGTPPLLVVNGGSGLTTATAHAVLTGEGTSAFGQVGPGGAGTLLAGVASADPTFTSTPTLGANGGTGGTLTLEGSTSGSGVIQVAAAAGAGIVFQLPSANGSSGNALTTNGAGITSWSPVGTLTSVTCGTGLSGGTITTTGTCSITAPVTVALGGTGSISASGTALDNITGFSGTGLVNRTGAGTYSFMATNAVAFTGGTIDGVTIGGTTPAAAHFTTLSTSGITTFGSGEVGPVRVVTASGAVTMATTDNTIEVDKTTGAATTVNLVSSPTPGTRLCVKDGKGDASANNITLSPAAGNIDGGATFIMNQNYQSTCIQYDGTKWIIS